MAIFVYNTDNETEPASARRWSSPNLPAQVTKADFRKNARGELGTRTETLHREGVLKLRENWVYKATVS
jgi:hypothetical protein